MTEKIALLGEARNLVGIVTQPEIADSPSHDLAVLLLNAGVIHRIGPGRLNVKLARALAARGFTSLRFDLSGIGDSRPAQRALPFAAQSVADVRAAMDYMQGTRATQRFVLAGLCSGADNSYATALADARVSGVVLIDPNAYPTWKTRPRFLLMGLGSPRWLLGSLRNHLRRLRPAPERRGEPAHASRQGAGPAGAEGDIRPKPPLAEFAAGLASVVGRGGAIIAIYSGSSLRQFNHVRQLDEALGPFGLAGRIDCRLCAQANHTFTELSAQAQLIDTIVEWIGDLAVGRGVTRVSA